MMKKYDGHYIHMPWADIAILVVYPLSFFLVHQIPRNPVLDPPARGKCLDKKIPAVDGELNWKVGRSELLFLHTDGAETGIEW
ncbi:MAG: hypothetical protein QGE94_00325 [Desulfobacterales bacterium]|nr:hypothetical protein [Desulfobacterales bacterium]